MRSAVGLIACVSIALAQPANVDELLRRGIAAHQRRDFTEAAKAYRLALEKRPDLIQARINLAAVLAETGHLDETIALLKPASDKPGVRRNLALAYYRADDLLAAIGEFEKLNPSERSDPQTVSLLADCYLRAGVPGKALAILESAVQAHPGEPRLQYQLGMARIRTGDPKNSLGLLESAGTAGSAEAYLLAGATAMDVGQFQRARDDLEKALRLDPKIPGVWTWTGMARDRVSDEEGAKEAYRAALKFDPRDFEANLHLGAILYRERDLAAAKPFIERALALQPGSALALYATALVRAASGEVEPAVQDLEKVTRAEPDWLEPHVKLASLYYRLRRENDARREEEVIAMLRNEHREKALPLTGMQ
jgi:tetratricopeptide (TPR) repeat protein